MSSLSIELPPYVYLSMMLLYEGLQLPSCFGKLHYYSKIISEYMSKAVLFGRLQTFFVFVSFMREMYVTISISLSHTGLAKAASWRLVTL